MKIKTKFIIYFSSIFVVVGIISGFMIWGTGKIESYLAKDLPAAVEAVRINSKLDITAQLIRYDDEVLTQSARNYAFTGQKKWKERYDEFAPKLDSRIKEALDTGSQEDKKIFSDINDANLALIDMETESIKYADDGNLVAAQQILDSEEYARHKEIYKAGIIKYLESRNLSVDSASAVSTSAVEQSRDYLSELSIIQKYALMGFVLLFFVILVLLFLLMIKTFMVPLGKFMQAAKSITSGDLDTRVSIDTEDEIGSFAKDFNKMTTSLQKSIENTEDKIKERTAELEKLNKFMTGRELKMIELKEKIKVLENKNEN